MPRRQRTQRAVISLFSGAGGLDMAAERCAEPPLVQDGTPGPLRVAVATDYEPAALETLKLNMPNSPVICGDIRELSVSELMSQAGLSRGEAGLVIGGPPCTPFSKSGFWLEQKRNSTDPDASLLDDYVRVVDEARPEGFVLENVQGLTYKTHASQFDRLLRAFAKLGYNPQVKVLLAAEYGVPQLRRRVFVVGRRDGEAFVFPETTHSGYSERDRRTVDLTKKPFVTAGKVLIDLLPGEPEADEVVEGTFAELAAEVPPGQNYLWHTDRYPGRNEFKWRSRYWTFLLRLDPDRPASTIQAQPGPWVGPFHWENVLTPNGERARRLRTTEILRLMTFPEGYRTRGDRTTVQRQVGNAVPVELGKVVLRSLSEQMGWLEPIASEVGTAS
jgi:DNA (cytosine-5)-methyltransferase 1